MAPHSRQAKLAENDGKPVVTLHLGDDRPNDKLPETSPDYGLYRGDDGKPGSYWQVFLTRQRRSIVRVFYDRTYGGSEAAQKMAVAYRDKIVAEIPLVPVQTLFKARPDSLTGKVGVSPAMRKGEQIGYKAVLINQGRQKTRLFNFGSHSREGALLQAEAQRDAWLAELVLEHYRASQGYYDPDNPYYSELFLDDPHWDEENDVWLDETIRAINTHFDALRPLWLTLRVAIHPGDRLQMTISDGGYPAEQRRAAVLYGKKGVAHALPKLRIKAIEIIKELFGIHGAAKFLARHAHKFEAESFDTDNGISIRERL